MDDDNKSLQNGIDGIFLRGIAYNMNHRWDHGGLQILMILTCVMGFIEKTLQPKFQVHGTIGCRDLAVLNLYKIQTGYFTGRNSNSYNFGLA